MNCWTRAAQQGACLILAALASAAAVAHSASDAYLTLIAQPRSAEHGAGGTLLQAQWDVALRDLDFVLGLDDDGDGNIVWGELRKHQAAIARYVYDHIHLSADGSACTVHPRQQLVDDHPDGAYAALLFDIVCSGAPKRLTLDYRLFFALDPSHRAIVVLRSGASVATSVLSPERPSIELPL